MMGKRPAAATPLVTNRNTDNAANTRADRRLIDPPPLRLSRPPWLRDEQTTYTPALPAGQENGRPGRSPGRVGPRSAARPVIVIIRPPSRSPGLGPGPGIAAETEDEWTTPDRARLDPTCRHGGGTPPS